MTEVERAGKRGRGIHRKLKIILEKQETGR